MWRRTSVILPVTIILAFLVSSAFAEEEPEASRYELKIGAKRCDVTLGEPFAIALPGGGRLQAVLSRSLATWSGRGVRFSHPGDMKVELSQYKSLLGFKIARGESLYVRMLIYPPGEKTPEKALDEALGGSRMLMEAVDKTTASESPHRQEIAGEVRVGVRLIGKDGDDPPRENLYAFPLGDRVIVIGIRSRLSNRVEAETVFQTIATSLAPAGDEDEEAAAPAAGFELRVGKRSRAIDLNKAFILDGPDGRKHAAVLGLGRKVYARFGIRFLHPGDTVARTQEKTGRVMIHVEHGDGYLSSLQLFLVTGLSSDAALLLAVKHVKSSVERTGSRFGPDKSCRRKFLGRYRKGTRLTTVGDEDPNLIEIYAFDIGERVISVLFLCRESNRKTAEKSFKEIASSLRKD